MDVNGMKQRLASWGHVDDSFDGGEVVGKILFLSFRSLYHTLFQSYCTLFLFPFPTLV